MMNSNPLVPEMLAEYVPVITEILYLIAISMFILGLKRLSSPATARSGNKMAAWAMLIGIVVTLFDQGIVSFEWIIAGIVIGSAIGIALAKKVEMTAMPELVAIFNGFGGGASAVVAGGEYMRLSGVVGTGDSITMAIGVLIGAVTFTGSFIAFGKLKGFVSGSPVMFPGIRVLTVGLFLVVLVEAVMFAMNSGDWLPLVVLAVVALILGILLVIPIGGADMPVVISLLNSYSGLAASAAGFVLNNSLLIVAGALVGASGLILTNIMCVAMNRSLFNVLFGAFGAGESAGPGSTEATGDKTVREAQADDVAVMTAYAQRVIIVPGYGLAVAQAQHACREVGDMLEEKGVDVRYGIHPVAGRMPGHMNVLLAEANVPYDKLFDMEEINSEFSKTDVVLIIGANDVVNPDARENESSPIYGMPILNVDEAKTTVVFKRSLNPGFAGIDNTLFYKENNYMFFGDAKKSLTELISAIKTL